MSVERAVINCRECYKYHREIMPEDCMTSEGYAARNEAMKALEDTQRDCREVVRDLGVSLEQTDSGIATQALRACLSCEYDKPCIDIIITEGPSC